MTTGIFPAECWELTEVHFGPQIMAWKCFPGQPQGPVTAQSPHSLITLAIPGVPSSIFSNSICVHNGEKEQLCSEQHNLTFSMTSLRTAPHSGVPGSRLEMSQANEQSSPQLPAQSLLQTSAPSAGSFVTPKGFISGFPRCIQSC